MLLVTYFLSEISYRVVSWHTLCLQFYSGVIYHYYPVSTCMVVLSPQALRFIRYSVKLLSDPEVGLGDYLIIVCSHLESRTFLCQGNTISPHAAR